MPDASALAAVYIAFIAGLVSPGPDLILISALALRGDRGRAVQAALGIACGVGAWAAAGALGVSALIGAAGPTWTGLKYVAGIILIYMGSRVLSAAIRMPDRADPPHVSADLRMPAFMVGLLTNLGNPKAAVVIVGLTAELSHTGAVFTDILFLVSGMPALTALWFIALATVLTAPAVQDRLRTWRRGIDGVCGLALAVAGALLLRDAGTPADFGL
jgi:threonine efflux protein